MSSPEPVYCTHAQCSTCLTLQTCCVLQDTKAVLCNSWSWATNSTIYHLILDMRTVTKGSLNGLVSWMGATTWRSMSPMAVQRPVRTTIAKTSSSAWSSFHTCQLFKENCHQCYTRVHRRYVAGNVDCTLQQHLRTHQEIMCKHALMVAIWQCIAIALIRCWKTAEVMALTCTFGPCDTGRSISCRHAKLLDDIRMYLLDPSFTEDRA